MVASNVLLGRRKHLTKREEGVVSLLASGHRNPEVAEFLGISVKTVETHIQSAKLALRAKTVHHLVAIYVYRGRDAGD